MRGRGGRAVSRWELGFSFGLGAWPIMPSADTTSVRFRERASYGVVSDPCPGPPDSRCSNRRSGRSSRKTGPFACNWRPAPLRERRGHHATRPVYTVVCRDADSRGSRTTAVRWSRHLDEHDTRDSAGDRLAGCLAQRDLRRHAVDPSKSALQRENRAARGAARMIECPAEERFFHGSARSAESRYPAGRSPDKWPPRESRKPSTFSARPTHAATSRRRCTAVLP